MTVNPTPSQVLAALRDYGVDVQTYKGWDTVGNAWQGTDGSPGLMGAVVHHTATASATGPHGSPSLWWAVNAYDMPVCNMLVGRGPGDTYLLSARSVYHCGLGGPVPALGVPEHGFFGQTRLFGIEIDDPGLSTSSLTDYQIENVGRILAALAGLAGWNVNKSVGTHKCYTDGCHGWNSKPSPSLGRKNDTIDGKWGEWASDPNPQHYNAPFWRQEAARRAKKTATWDGTVPSLDACTTAWTNKSANKAAWRTACRLFDLNFKRKPAAALGTQVWPTEAITAFKTAQGWADDTGKPTDALLRRLFNMSK